MFSKKNYSFDVSICDCRANNWSLSFQVKLQFFETFILPYFDYCSTLIIYFTNTVIQKISNYFYTCIFKLLNLKFSSIFPPDFNSINNQLEKLGLNSFQHRIFIRLMTFSYKLFSSEFVPLNLKNLFVENDFPYNLRNCISNTFTIPDKGILNNYGERTFHYLFSIFINTFCKNKQFTF